MGFTKSKGFSIVITVIALVMFNIAAFLLPCAHTVEFWMHYAFAVFSILLALAAGLIFLGKENPQKRFLRLPAISLSWIYSAVQIIFSVSQMVTEGLPYNYGIIIDIALAGIASILLILLFASAGRNEEFDKEANKKIFFIKNLQAEVELMTTSDIGLSASLNNLAEVIRYSDPMSHSQLSGIENTIVHKTADLKKNIANTDLAKQLCEEIRSLFKERNKKCLILKNVPEEKKMISKDNSGIKYAAAAFGVLALASLAVLAVFFVIIPLNKYNSALALYNSGQYEEAIYEFGQLGNYKDSDFRITSAKEKLMDTEYELAEKYYQDRNYIEALNIYSGLDGYKDSQNRIEQINNMFAQNGEIYFGTYKGNSIAWKILKTETDRMLLITQDVVEHSPFNDELRNIIWETSSLRQWLNSEFLLDFSSEQKSRIIPNDNDGLNDMIFILNESEYDQYNENIDFAISDDWWLRTKTPAGMKYVYAGSEDINHTGESVVRALGVRPCVWISLK